MKGNGSDGTGDINGIVVGPQFIEIHDTKSKFSNKEDN